jgi:asparagine synthase (glutamine-hydrolysing)
MTQESSKVALRRLARRYLPEDIINRRKQGFVLPMRTWLEAWFHSRGMPLNYLSCRNFPHLDMARLADLVMTDLAAGVQRERLIFAIVMLLEWWCAFQVKRTRLVAIRKSLNNTSAANRMAP